MMKKIFTLCILSVSPVLFVACDDAADNKAAEPENKTQVSTEHSEDIVATPSQDIKIETISEDSADTSAWIVTLMPPEPGEAGALPDDRTPLDESDKDSDGLYGAGQTVQMYGAALESGDYQAAYDLWKDDGQSSGMSYQQFEASMLRYDDLHVLTGRPVMNAEQQAEVPVQMYGVIRSQETAFNTYGPLLLEKDEQNTWVITESQLQPMGEISMSVGRIPSRFQGVWASAGACGLEDPRTIEITPHKIDYYESVETIENVIVSDNTISFTATFTGEGSTGTTNREYTLSDDGKMLTTPTNIERILCE